MLLGPSETVGRKAGLFEAVSRKWRVYRRTGTGTRRPGRVDFPILARGGRLRREGASDGTGAAGRLVGGATGNRIERDAGGVAEYDRGVGRVPTRI